MTVAERQARHRAARARQRAAAAPVIEGIMGAAEMAAVLKIGTMPAAQLASLMAQPGAVDCDDDSPRSMSLASRFKIDLGAAPAPPDSPEPHSAPLAALILACAMGHLDPLRLKTLMTTRTF